MTERRYLTIAYCDLVGSTALSESVDPEELQVLLSQYQQRYTSIVYCHGGYVVNLAGDGLLIDFGYPTAPGNDAERAVLAVLASIEIVEEVQKIATALPSGLPQTLSVRIGIRTGLVIIGPETVGWWQLDHSIVGEAANLAARLQSEAEPNTILITRETLDLVEGLFDVVELGPAIKGLSRDVLVFKISGRSANPDRGYRRFARGATRMIGRESQLAEIIHLWELALSESKNCAQSL